MKTDPETVTLSEVVHRAIEVVDPSDQHPDLDNLFRRFEDADEPVTAVGDVEERVAEAVGAIDPDETDPALTMARAVIVYLAYRRDELGDDREKILRLGARAEFHGHPPPAVEDWLADQGVTV
jgi:hypothetical protein